MIKDLEIRESRPPDVSAIAELYPDAFPDEDLLPLVRELLAQDEGVVSLVALAGGTLAGHVAFSDCGVAGKTVRIALLAPLAVATARQRQGIGSALIRYGFKHLEETGTDIVCVLGDPAYYSRFGFEAEHHVAPPYPLPEEWKGAWQSVALNRQAEPANGILAVPQAWRRRELWAP